MKEIVLSPEMVKSIEDIYNKLEELYGDVAQKIRFTCEGCPDNCCDSYFLHYTYLEWAYLHIGMKALPQEKQAAISLRAMEYQEECNKAKVVGNRPQVMCPLNEEGLCLLYNHRLLVCRTHGVPATMGRPDGQRLEFPGCFRCQQIVDKKYMHQSEAPKVERTPFLQRLANLENELLENKRHEHPKVRMTIAEMLVQGPPEID